MINLKDFIKKFDSVNRSRLVPIDNSKNTKQLIILEGIHFDFFPLINLIFSDNHQIPQFLSFKAKSQPVQLKILNRDI